jgi:hypothetical protein
MKPGTRDRDVPAWVIAVVRWPVCVVLAITAFTWYAVADDEAYVVTPRGFTQPGVAIVGAGANTGRLPITVCDRASGLRTFCRLNVVGPDGNFYQPAASPLSPYNLVGQWPRAGKGNREGKAPIRYLGRFFYSSGRVDVAVPNGDVRIGVWKGSEYQPVMKSLHASAGQTQAVTIELERTAPMATLGYHSGDPHLHFPRKADADDEVTFNLLEAEDICFGSILAYNEPAGLYTGRMELLDAPQFRGLGGRSVRRRGET